MVGPSDGRAAIIKAVCVFALSLCVVAPDAVYAIEFAGGGLINGPGGRNNRHDTSPRACDLDIGCFTDTGARCADNPNDRCLIQVTPLGRCTQGSGSCLWPAGAGLCEHDGGETPVDPVACLTDAYLDFLAGKFPQPANPLASGDSRMCEDARGSNGRCDMSTNDPSCDCTGLDPTADPGNTDPSKPSWEGIVCGAGDLQAVCSDGDPERYVQGFGGNLCGQICLEPANCPVSAACGANHTAPGVSIGVKYPNGENPQDKFTLQRRPGVGLSSASVAAGPVIAPISTTPWRIDDVGTGDFAAWGMRRLNSFPNGVQVDHVFDSAGVNGVLDAVGPSIFVCEAPLYQGWSSGAPIDGRCQIDTETVCILDADCVAEGDICDPDSLVFCNDGDNDLESIDDLHFDAIGFLWTRALTPQEIIDVDRVCPPDCRRAYDFDTFEEEALVMAATSKDYRASVQLTLDNMEGERVRAGDLIISSPIHVQLVTFMGDARCYIGGDPDRADPAKIGRCSSEGVSCDPTVPTAQNGCTVGAGQCLYCDGTASDAKAPHPENFLHATFGGKLGHHSRGNDLATPIGFDTHGVEALSPIGRIGRLNGVASSVDIPLVILLSHGPVKSSFKDNTCPLAGTDRCALGETTGGGMGIGAGTTYEAGTPVPYERFSATAPPFAETLVIPPANPGSLVDTQVFTQDWGVGPDGIPGCIGDNTDPQVDPPAACDERLGEPTSPGSTGQDDPFLLRDYSENQDGSDMRAALLSRIGPLKEPFAIVPTWTNNATLTVRDLNAGANTDGLDAVSKNEVSFCPLVFRRGHSLDFKFACTDSDLDQDGWLDEQDGCPLDPEVGVIDPDLNPDRGGVENPNSDPGGQLPDGIADVCQCGDVNNDGRVTGNDSTFIKRACLGLPPFQNTVVGEVGCAQSQPGPPANAQPFNRDKCDVGSGGGGPGGCSGNDATVVRRRTLGLAPGIQNTCTAYGQLP